MSRIIYACALLGLVGCSVTDPLTREGVWRPMNANAANLRAMVAVPSDLVQGVAARSADGHQAARAMDRLRADRVYPLPDSGISKVGASGSSAPPPPTGTPE